MPCVIAALTASGAASATARVSSTSAPRRVSSAATTAVSRGSQAMRVTRPGGRVIFVDYHGPRKSNPMRYVMKPILTWLEPFAMDLWREELPAFMPASVDAEQISSDFYFGGLYQKIVLQL